VYFDVYVMCSNMYVMCSNVYVIYSDLYVMCPANVYGLCSDVIYSNRTRHFVKEHLMCMECILTCK